ncbi:MAG TPA: serine/threonine-protein kinase [Pseudonocardia sp.]
MSAPEGDPLRIGGRYRIEEQIGVGAMGAVWRGTDELLNRPVAIKELLPLAPGTSAADVEESRQRILREGRISARLRHAHVISMFDVVIHDDRPWLVMEYLPSDSLATVLRRKGPLLPVQVAAIGRDVADGLAAAHLAGVVHRDVKPGNVLIGGDGLVKLTDFGVSRAVDDVQLTRTGLIAGTPAFLAPEIAQGRTPTAASDVFALGATLYAAVEGVPPFGLDENAYALLHKVATGTPEPPQHAGPLTAVLMRLLAVDPDERPSAAQARDLLGAVAAGQDPLPSPSAQPDRPGATSLFSPAAASGPATRPDLVAAVQAPARGGQGRSRTRLLIAGVLAVLVLGGGSAAYALARAGSGTAQAAPPATAAAADPTTPPASAAPPPTAATSAAPSPQPSASVNPPPSATPSPAAGGTDPVAFVQRYYALLPDHPDAAFAMLSPTAQSESGGHAGFANFYADMATVTLQDPRQTSDNTVSARVRFVRKSGVTTSEAYNFTMGTATDGTTVMQSFSR